VDSNLIYKRAIINEFPNYSVDTEGNVFNKKNKILKPRFCGQGNYYAVCLCKDGNCKQQYIHRLVAKAFLKNPNNKYSVNHKDGNKNNNKLSNLEWATGIEQNNHAFSIGLTPTGEGVANSKLKEYEVHEIRNNTTMRNKELAIKYNVSQALISLIKYRRVWKYI